MGTDIKVVVFDLGRVLVDFDHRIAAQKISEFSSRDPQQIYDLFFDSPITRNFEEGKISPEEFFREISRELGLNLDFDKFRSIWNQIFFLSEENRSVYALGKELKRKHRLALLSNVNILHFNYLKDNFPVFDIFHHIFASCEMGCMKPSPEIYHKVVSSLAVKSGEIFYVDDRPELIESACRLGIRGFVFKGTKQLKADLRSCGIELDEKS